MDDFILKITAEIVITQEDVDDIMSTALDSSTLQCWCSEVNVVGRYLGEYASEQISRGGELELYEIEEETYRSLTLENFKTGLLKLQQTKLSSTHCLKKLYIAEVRE